MPITREFRGMSRANYTFRVAKNSFSPYDNKQWFIGVISDSSHYYLHDNGHWKEHAYSVISYCSNGYYATEEDARKMLMASSETNYIIDDIVAKESSMIGVASPANPTNRMAFFLELIGLKKSPLGKVVFGSWGRVYRG